MKLRYFAEIKCGANKIEKNCILVTSRDVFDMSLTEVGSLVKNDTNRLRCAVKDATSNGISS